MKYLFMGELGYEAAQTNVAYILDKGIFFFDKSRSHFQLNSELFASYARILRHVHFIYFSFSLLRKRFTKLSPLIRLSNFQFY